MKRTISAVALFAIAGTASAMSGNTLLARMSGSNAERANAYGYIDGVSSGLQIGGFVCFPDDSTIGQGFDIVKRALESTPSVRHEDAAILSGGALMAVFPCKDKAKAPSL